MDYERRYREALERMKSWARGEHPECFTEAQKAAEFIFPELAESKDESIRKELLEHCKKLSEMYNTLLTAEEYNKKQSWITWLEKQGEKANPYSGISFEYNGHTWGMCARDNGVDILLDKQLFTHLEKQGEQKPTDMVNPKFKVGDWCIDNEDGTIFQIVKVLDGTYIYKTNEGKEYYCFHYPLEKDAHLWTVKDAKDGDVLVDVYGNIGIFEKGCEINWHTYCYLGFDGRFISEGGSHGSICYPATKEQQDILFHKMEEAGYEWDANKKELKKIEQKSAWSEDDEIGLDDALWCCKQAASIAKDENDMGNAWYAENWLKSIKDRIGYGLIYTVKDDESTDEQKPTDKVKPKFKVGDWIVDNRTGVVHYIAKIKGTVDGCYYVLGYDRGLLHVDNESDYHLWTIRDAKDGDVLVDTSSDKMIIFHKIGNETWNDVIDYYVAAKDGYFNIPKGVQYWSSIHTCKLKPATADQRDLLFEQIGKAGYIWDDHAKMLICSTDMKSK